MRLRSLAAVSDVGAIVAFYVPLGFGWGITTGQQYYEGCYQFTRCVDRGDFLTE